MRAGNLGFIIEVPNISLPHLEAWSHVRKITFEIEAWASIRGNTVSFIYADQCRLLWPGPFAFSSIASDGFQVSLSGAEGPGSSSLSSSIT